jgi:hypothetical protein
MQEPSKTHPWAPPNLVQPGAYPPQEVSYLLAIERELLDDTRYAVREILEARKDITLSDAIGGALTMVDVARRHWRAALLASAALPPRPVAAISERVATLEAAVEDSSELIAHLRAEIEERDRRLVTLQGEVDRHAASAARARVDENRARSELLAAKTAALANDTARTAGPGPDHETTVGDLERMHDALHRLAEGPYPWNEVEQFEFIRRSAAEEWIVAQAHHGLTGTPVDMRVAAGWLVYDVPPQTVA